MVKPYHRNVYEKGFLLTDEEETLEDSADAGVYFFVFVIFKVILDLPKPELAIKHVYKVLKVFMFDDFVICQEKRVGDVFFFPMY